MNDKIDLEIEAMRQIATALRSLQPPVRDIVLRWAIERFLGEREDSAMPTVEAPSVGPGPQRQLEEILRSLDGMGLCSALGAMVGELAKELGWNTHRLCELVGMELGGLTARRQLAASHGSAALDTSLVHWCRMVPFLQRGFERGFFAAQGGAAPDDDLEELDGDKPELMCLCVPASLTEPADRSLCPSHGAKGETT